MRARPLSVALGIVVGVAVAIHLNPFDCQHPRPRDAH